MDGAGLARWLASFTELVAIIMIQEPAGRLQQRVRREIRRVGWFRFLDVLAFRVFYRFFLASGDHRWYLDALAELQHRYPPVPSSCRILQTPSPNSPEAEALLRELAPDLAVARCKTLLAQRIFTIPQRATLVLHPGICPPYRNAHGCFWALAKRDLSHVGMTLLAIDKGIDTGPIYGHYSYEFDEQRESHIVIQYRAVLENLDLLAAKILELFRGEAPPVDVTGWPSAEWGQPWLSSYWSWKAAAQKAGKSVQGQA